MRVSFKKAVRFRFDTICKNFLVFAKGNIIFVTIFMRSSGKSMSLNQVYELLI